MTPTLTALTATTRKCASFSKNVAILQDFKHRAQEIDQETALETERKTNRIPFTLAYHPQKRAVKNVILKNFKIPRHDPETKQIFSLPTLI